MIHELLPTVKVKKLPPILMPIAKIKKVLAVRKLTKHSVPVVSKPVTQEILLNVKSAKHSVPVVSKPVTQEILLNVKSAKHSVPVVSKPRIPVNETLSSLYTLRPIKPKLPAGVLAEENMLLANASNDKLREIDRKARGVDELEHQHRLEKAPSNDVTEDAKSSMVEPPKPPKKSIFGPLGDRFRAWRAQRAADKAAGIEMFLVEKRKTQRYQNVDPKLQKIFDKQHLRGKRTTSFLTPEETRWLIYDHQIHRVLRWVFTYYMITRYPETIYYVGYAFVAFYTIWGIHRLWLYRKWMGADFKYGKFLRNYSTEYQQDLHERMQKRYPNWVYKNMKSKNKGNDKKK